MAKTAKSKGLSLRDIASASRNGKAAPKAGATDPESDYQNDAPSQQPTNPAFGRMYVPPPYPPTKLQSYYREGSWHKACVDAKRDSIVGDALKIVPNPRLPKDAKPPEDQRDMLYEWLDQLCPEQPVEEVLKAVVEDFENVGYSFFEIAPNLVTGLPQHIYYLPAQTCRIHREIHSFQQIWGGRIVNFWNFNSDQKTLAANWVMELKRPNPRSTFYGVPDYLAAVGAILGDLLARDFNLEMFDSKLLADWAIIFGGDIPDPVKQEIRQHFEEAVQKGKRYMPLLLKAIGGAGVDSVKFQRLTAEIKDASFASYRKFNRDEILAVHRVPPNKITAFEGSRFQTSPEQSEQFRDEVIQPKQKIFEFHFNKIVRMLGITDWVIKLPQMDLTEDVQQAEIAYKLSLTGGYKRNEIRKITGHDALTPEEGGDDFLAGRGEGGTGALGAPDTTQVDANAPGAGGKGGGGGASGPKTGKAQGSAKPTPSASVRKAIASEADRHNTVSALRRLETTIAKTVIGD